MSDSQFHFEITEPIDQLAWNMIGNSLFNTDAVFFLFRDCKRNCVYVCIRLNYWIKHRFCFSSSTLACFLQLGAFAGTCLDKFFMR